MKAREEILTSVSLRRKLKKNEPTPSAAEKQPHQPSSDLVYDPANSDTVVPHHSGQAVDRQEWAKAYGPSDNCVQVGSLVFEVTMSASLIADKINAGLAAERQRNFDAEKELHDKARQRIKELTTQLLSALAAIEKINKLTLNYVRADLALQQIRIWSHDIDELSILHQHDAETRAQAKADVFRALNVTYDLNREWFGKQVVSAPYRLVADALAKVKEKP